MLPPKSLRKAEKTYLSLNINDFSAHVDPLPGALYLCVNQKMVRYLQKGQILGVNSYNHLICKRVRFVFIEERDKKAFQSWLQIDLGTDLIDLKDEEIRVAVQIIDKQRNSIASLFQAPRDQQIRQAVQETKKLVAHLLKHPYAADKVVLLQKYSKGLFDHSVNVSLLSVFFAFRMDYTDSNTLENLAIGGLLHDIGKVLFEDRKVDESHPAMQEHPRVGRQFLDSQEGISREAKKIVMQHHEFLDGSGYPDQLRGFAIYDLARIVAIANVYDNLITQSNDVKSKDGVNQAIERLETEYSSKLDPPKLKKIIHILRSSFI